MQDNRFRDDLLARVSIADVIAKRVKLKKRGREYIGLCPFHNEKTPSFSVVEDKDFYHCFGCGASGNAITFVMETEGLTYPEAIRHLADSVGMKVPEYRPPDPEKQKQRLSSYELLKKACDYFVRSLTADVGAAANDYLKGRGLTDATIAEFSIGFAPEGKEIITDVFKTADDATWQLLDELSLVRKSESNNDRYAFFRNRIMFPIHDRKGQIIGFGGRYMGSKTDVGKYINSSDSELFHKGDNLYNIHRAMKSVKEAKALIAAEGYMDVIALAQAGFAAVAPLGTAITENQLRMLWRLHPSPIMAFDGDNAGREAAKRAAKRALPLLTPQQTLRFMFLPNGEDPDSFLQTHGRTAFAELLEQAQNIEDFLWESEVAAAPLNSFAEKADLRDRLMNICKQVENRELSKIYSAGFGERLFQHFRVALKKEARARQIQKPNLTKTVRLEGAGILFKLSRFPGILDQFLERLFELDFLWGKNLDKFLIDLQAYCLSAHETDFDKLDTYMNREAEAESTELWKNMHQSDNQRLAFRVRQGVTFFSKGNVDDGVDDSQSQIAADTENDIVTLEHEQERNILQQQIKDAIKSGADDETIHELRQHLEKLKIHNQPPMQT